MSNGWVKLHRGLLEHGIFRDAAVLQVWMYLLLRASYREQKLAIGRQVIFLQPGQLLYGRKAVSEKLSMGEGKLRGIMEMLEQSGSITVESSNRYSVVTIVNWMEYQQGESAPEFPFVFRPPAENRRLRPPVPQEETQRGPKPSLKGF